MKRVANLSVDLDGLAHYHRIHAIGADADPRAIYEVAMPRLLTFCEQHGVRMTLFVIASDLQFTEAVDALRRALEAGHELASHTFRHPYHIRELSEAGIAEEIDEAGRWIDEALGVRPVGFRTPGYNVDSRILALLSERGYRYDSSVFPCPAYFAAKTAIMARMSSQGRPSGSSAVDPASLLAPIDPYHPSRWAYWRRGDRKHSLPIWEIPVGVTPGPRLPVIGTSVCALPPVAAKALAHAFRAGRDFVEVGIHAVDFMDERDPGVAAELAARQPDLRRSWPRKSESLGAFVDTLRTTHTMGTLAEMVDELDRLEPDADARGRR